MLIAAFAQAPMVQDVIDAAWREVGDLTGAAPATEKAKLDLQLELLRKNGIVA